MRNCDTPVFLLIYFFCIHSETVSLISISIPIMHTHTHAHIRLPHPKSHAQNNRINQIPSQWPSCSGCYCVMVKGFGIRRELGLNISPTNY